MVQLDTYCTLHMIYILCMYVWECVCVLLQCDCPKHVKAANM